MGVDVSIFAKNNKTRFNADRDRVLYQTKYHDLDCYDDDGFESLDSQKIENLNEKFRDVEQGLNQQEAFIFLEANLKAAQERQINFSVELEYEIWWLEAMIQFVKLIGEDTYLALTDHSEDYHELYDEYPTVYDCKNENDKPVLYLREK